MAGALLGSIPVALVYSFFVEHYFRWRPRHRHLRHVSGAADASLHSASRYHPQLPPRRHYVAGLTGFHAVVERVHLRAGISVLTGGEDRAGRGHIGADPRRRVGYFKAIPKELDQHAAHGHGVPARRRACHVILAPSVAAKRQEASCWTRRTAIKWQRTCACWVSPLLSKAMIRTRTSGRRWRCEVRFQSIPCVVVPRTSRVVTG
jgi:hypothetical protein